jgi:pyruvate kinase
MVLTQTTGKYAIDFGKRSNFIAPGDNVVVITGWKKGSGSSNTVRILPVS